MNIFLSFLALFPLIIFFLSLQKVRAGQTFTTTPYLSWLGIFVWGDGLIVAPFWGLSTIVSLWVSDIFFFLTLLCIFWFVRAYGEVNYWIHEQFAGKNRNRPEDLVGFRFVNSEAIYFLYQLFWQMVMVVTLLGSIYCGYQWLQ